MPLTHSTLVLKVIGGGLASALTFLSLFTFHPLSFLLVGFTPLALYYMALGYHPSRGVLAGGVGCLGLAVVYGPVISLVYGFLFVGPIAFLAITYSKGLIVYPPQPHCLSLEKLILGQVGYFVVLVIILLGLGKELFAAEAPLLRQLSQHFHTVNGDLGLKEWEAMVRFLPYVPGLTALWASLMGWVNGAIAWSILKRNKRFSLGISPLDQINLPFSWWITLASLGLLALAGGGSLWGMGAQNVILVLLIPFLIEGLSVLSVLWGHQKKRALLLWGMAGIAFLLNFLLLGVVILGIFEPWLKLRQKIRDRRRDQ